MSFFKDILSALGDHLGGEKIDYALELDNEVQPAVLTLAELKHDVQALSGVKFVRFVRPCRNSDRELVRKVMRVCYHKNLTQPQLDALDAAILALIDGNPGAELLVGGVACIPQFFVADTDDTAGIAYTGTANFEADPAFTDFGNLVSAVQVLNAEGALGQLLADGTYQDFGNSASASRALLVMQSAPTQSSAVAADSTGMILRAGETVTVLNAGGGSVAVSPQQDIEIRWLTDAAVGFRVMQFGLLIDEQGNLYPLKAAGFGSVPLLVEVIVGGVNILDAQNYFESDNDQYELICQDGAA